MSDEAFTFRPLRMADKAEVLAISAKIWEGDDYLPSSFDDWAADPDGVFNGCFLGDRLIGLGRVGFVAPGHAWLEGLRKDPDAGVRGVGKALCLEALRFLSGVGGLRSIRFSAYAHNPETIALNEALGFRRFKTLSVKSKRLPGGPAGKEPFGRALAAPDARTVRPVPGAGGRASALARLRADGWFDGFRVESWKAYPTGASTELKADDIVLEARSGSGEPSGYFVGSLDPLKAQANVVAFSAADGRSAEALFAAFEEAATARGYHYLEAVAPREGGRLQTLDACGYVSWESEDDFLLYEWPPELLGSLPAKNASSSSKTAG